MNSKVIDTSAPRSCVVKPALELFYKLPLCPLVTVCVGPNVVGHVSVPKRQRSFVCVLDVTERTPCPRARLTCLFGAPLATLVRQFS